MQRNPAQPYVRLTAKFKITRQETLLSPLMMFYSFKVPECMCQRQCNVFWKTFGYVVAITSVK